MVTGAVKKLPQEKTETHKQMLRGILDLTHLSDWLLEQLCGRTTFTAAVFKKCHKNGSRPKTWLKCFLLADFNIKSIHIRRRHENKCLTFWVICFWLIPPSYLLYPPLDISVFKLIYSLLHHLFIQYPIRYYFSSYFVVKVTTMLNVIHVNNQLPVSLAWFSLISFIVNIYLN